MSLEYTHIIALSQRLIKPFLFNDIWLAIIGSYSAKMKKYGECFEKHNWQGK